MVHEQILRWLKARGFEPIEVPEPEGTWRILGRVPQEKRSAWIAAVGTLLEAADGAAWRIDVSETYLRKDGALARAWRVVVLAADLELVVEDLPDCEVREMPLPGATGERNSTLGGRRGAAPTEKAVVGPAAVRARSEGS